MSTFCKDTFEEKNSTELETIEWDDLWFQEANNENIKRVLFIGDSITRGFVPFINEMLMNENTVADRLTTSKSVDNPFFFDIIDYAIAQQPKCEVIHILLGGHGNHLEISDYEKDYKKIIKYITEKYSDKKFILASFTPLRKTDNLKENRESNDNIVKRNAVAKKTAEEYGFTFVDLYKVINNSENSEKFYLHDGVHLTDDGYKALAEASFSEIIKHLKEK